MKRWILLAAVVASTPYATDKLVDWQLRTQHEEKGYTKSERDGMDKLIERAMPVRHTTAMPVRLVRDSGLKAKGMRQPAGPVQMTRDERPRFDYPFACDDTNMKCLTLLAETKRSKHEPKFKMVVKLNSKGRPQNVWDEETQNTSKERKNS